MLNVPEILDIIRTYYAVPHLPKNKHLWALVICAVDYERQLDEEMFIWQ
jgi:hypothetical protein